jgi:galactose mutarotase-like enzyme
MQRHLSSPDWEFVLNLQGGRIEKLTYRKELILGTFDRKDGKKSNTHVCTPNFNREGTKEYGLPVHGPPRNTIWQVKTDDRTYFSIYCIVPATDLYKAGLYVEQVFELRPGLFKQTVVVENTQGSKVPVNIGIHNYWAVPHGWKGTRLNGCDISRLVETNGQRELRKSNTVRFPDGRRFRLQTKGFEDVKLWAAPDNNGVYDDAYVCIEPVLSLGTDYFGSKQSMLGEGKSFIASQEIGMIY